MYKTTWKFNQGEAGTMTHNKMADVTRLVASLVTQAHLQGKSVYIRQYQLIEGKFILYKTTGNSNRG